MKKFIFLIICVVCLTLSSCGLSHIEDTNGETDFTLSTLKNEEILTYNKSVTSMISESSLNNSFSFSCKKLSGNYLVKTITPRNKNITVTINTTINSGNAFVALVCNNEVYKEISLNSITTIKINGGTEDYRLRILGESCNISIKVTISTNE